MQQIQYVSKYLALAEEGLVSRMDCPIDQGLLFPNLDNDDNIFLYCISCSYKKNIGLDLYNKIKEKVEENNE
jgi:DNA-directed RNA polymerase subunit M/transcription elongation factor TFIIS